MFLKGLMFGGGLMSGTGFVFFALAGIVALVEWVAEPRKKLLTSGRREQLTANPRRETIAHTRSAILHLETLLSSRELCRHHNIPDPAVRLVFWKDVSPYVATTE